MSISHPMVTVVIPTYNRPDLLKRAIISVINQSYKNLEIIIIDDASSSDNAIVVNAFKDPRIKFLKNAKNKGLAASRNEGLNMASGEFINFLDDDDELDLTKIEKQVDLFYRSPIKPDLVYCGYRYMYKNRIIKEGRPRHRGQIFCQAIDDSLTIVTHCALIRKDAIVSIGGFDKTLKSAEDFEFWIRFAKFYKYDYVSEILVTYHLHESGNMTKQLKTRIEVREQILEKYKVDFNSNKSAYSVHLCRLGALYYMFGERAKSRRHILQSILVWPFHWKGYVYFILMLLDLFKPGTLEYFGTFNYGNTRSYY